MTDLVNDKFDPNVENFLKERGIDAVFIIAVDKNGEPHGFGDPNTAFQKTQDEGQRLTPSRTDCAGWTVGNSGECRIGGSKYRW